MSTGTTVHDVVYKLRAARGTGDPVVIGSLFRSVAHALLSTGRYAEAIRLTEDAVIRLRQAW